MTPEELTREWHDVELENLPGGGETGWRSPFWSGLPLGGLPHGKTEHPQTVANAKRWWQLNDAGSRGEEIAHPRNMEARDGIALALRMAKIGWHRQVHPETGATGIFPTVQHRTPGSPAEKAAADEWERKSSAPLHANQLHIVIDPLAPNGYRFEKQNAAGEPGPVVYHEHVERKRKLEALNKERAAKEKQNVKEALAEQPTARPPTITRGD